MEKEVKRLIEIEELKRDLNYENQEGEHTYHLCDCGRRGCRGNKCSICLEEELQKTISHNIGKEKK